MQYKLKAYRSPEGVTVLQLVAVDVADARQQAESMGYRVISMRRQFHWALELGGLKLRQRFSVALFSQELLALLEAGLSLVESIDLLARKSRQAETTKILEMLGSHLRQGLSLDELVTHRYIRKIPIDPITDSNRTWMIVAPADTEKGGVFDVHSGATGRARDGTFYRDW